MNPAFIKTIYIGVALSKPSSHIDEPGTEGAENQIAVFCHANPVLFTDDGFDLQRLVLFAVPRNPKAHRLRSIGEAGRIRVGVPAAIVLMTDTHRELLSPCRTPTSVASYFDRIVASSCSAHHIHILLSRQQHRNVGLHSQHAPKGRFCQDRGRKTYLEAAKPITLTPSTMSTKAIVSITLKAPNM